MRAELLLMELASLSNTPQRGPWLLLSCEDTERPWGINICRLSNPIWGIFRSSGLRQPAMDELESIYSLCHTNYINIPLSCLWYIIETNLDIWWRGVPTLFFLRCFWLLLSFWIPYKFYKNKKRTHKFYEFQDLNNVNDFYYNCFESKYLFEENCPLKNIEPSKVCTLFLFLRICMFLFSTLFNNYCVELESLLFGCYGQIYC